MTAQPPKPRLTELSYAAAVCFVCVAYLAALAAASVFVRADVVADPLWEGAAADALATVVIFAFSCAVRNTSMYDAYWSVAPVPLAVFWAGHASADGDPTRAWLVVALVCIWGLRLTLNWTQHFTGMAYEDWRYTDFRVKTGRLYPLVDFFGLHFFPTVIVFIAMLPVWVATMQGGREFWWLDVVAAAVTLSAISIEALADVQLHRFLKTREPGEIMQTGLWRWSRHPNYFGQMLFWWGLALFAIAVDTAFWWTASGALAISLMFVFISVPLLDTRSIERRPGYAEHARRVSALIPLPRR